MIDQTVLPYGCDDPSKLFNSFYQTGNEILLSLRNIVTSPHNKKEPRTWGLTEAARLVGVSEPTFRRLLERHHADIPETSQETKDSEQDQRTRRFTLKTINFLRDQAGTRYQRAAGSKSLVVAISNLKGGVGKTATAVDLGKKIAIEGLRALLLDFDAQGTATLLSSGLIPDFELPSEATITNCLLNDPQDIVNIIMPTHFDGFDIIPANLAIQDCDLKLPTEVTKSRAKLPEKEYISPFHRLAKALGLIRDRYDVILIDCGPNLGALTLNAVIACDGIIIPIPPSMSDYASFITYTATLRDLFGQLKDKKLEYLRILLTKHNGNSRNNEAKHNTGNKEALQVESMMRQQFGRYILSNHMCETVEIAKAANEIGTIYDVSKPRGSRDAYRRAIQHLDDVNLEIIDHFKEIWSRQPSSHLPTEATIDVG